MFTADLTDLFSAQKIATTGNKFIELAKQTFCVESKKGAKNGSSTYVIRAIKLGLTVIDLTPHKRSFVFEMLRLEKYKGNVVSFETNTQIYKYLFGFKRLLRLKRVTIEPSLIAAAAGIFSEDNSLSTTSVNLATVIDFNTKIKKRDNNSVAKTLDDYCYLHDITPALLKVSIDGNEVNLLEGAIEIIEKHKPAILLECGHHNKNRESLLATFKLLTDLKYSGYFILDSMRIPLRSFDFSTYQNEVLGFYCNTFYFE